MTKFVTTKQTKPTNILIVEDERAVARDLQDCLEGLGYQVVAIAGSSTEALDYVATLQPNLVLMDIVLEDSDQDGIDTARQIRDRFAIPVIFLTAHATPSVVAQVQTTNPFGYVLKPFREKDLWVAIETALQRSATEQNLADRATWFTQILTHIGAGVIVFDAQTQVQCLNTIATELTGWEQAHALNLPLQQILPLVKLKTQESVLTTELIQPLSNQPPIAIEGLLLASGQVMPVVYSIVSLLNAEGDRVGGVIIFRDLHSLQAQLGEDGRTPSAPRQLPTIPGATSSQFQTGFFANLSTELRTPLTDIKMMAKMLSLNLEQLNLGDTVPRDRLSSMAHTVKRLNEQTDYEIKLINNLLDIFDLQAQTYPLELTTIGLETWLPKMLEPFYLRANQNTQVLRLVMPTELPPCQTDPHYLSQILTVLLNHACRHTPSGEQIVVTVKCQAPSLPVGKNILLLEVCNFGMYLAPDDQAQIFDEFYHISHQTAVGTSGDRQQQRETGLELPLVKRFVQLLGGQVHVMSEEKPARTCFLVKFPLIQSDTTI